MISDVEKRLAVLSTRDIAGESWRDNGIVYVAGDRDEAIELSDSYAPEHLELHVYDKDYFFDGLKNYGSLFIGEETTVAYGDRTIGTNYILPTIRAARYTGGVWVGKFLKACTYQHDLPSSINGSSRTISILVIVIRTGSQLTWTSSLMPERFHSS